MTNSISFVCYATNRNIIEKIKFFGLKEKKNFYFVSNSRLVFFGVILFILFITQTY